MPAVGGKTFFLFDHCRVDDQTIALRAPLPERQVSAQADIVVSGFLSFSIVDIVAFL
jgi:hypothetical protein